MCKIEIICMQTWGDSYILSNEMYKIQIIFFQAWGDSCILPNEMYKIEIIFFRPEETQMSSDEFRVTQHVMKTIKDEMPAIVRSMVIIFLIAQFQRLSWVTSIPLIFINKTIIYDYDVITRSNLPRYLTRWRLPWLWPVSPLLRPGACISCIKHVLRWALQRRFKLGEEIRPLS